MKTIVIGGGASGMIAAIFQARQGAEVTIIEKNEKLGDIGLVKSQNNAYIRI